MTRAPKRNNARLEWRGRKLMCNGREIGEVGNYLGIWANRFSGYAWRWHPDTFYKTEAAARRAVSRRFGMEDVK